jgi:hypothetical protein
VKQAEQHWQHHHLSTKLELLALYLLIFFLVPVLTFQKYADPNLATVPFSL